MREKECAHQNIRFAFLPENPNKVDLVCPECGFETGFYDIKEALTYIGRLESGLAAVSKERGEWQAKYERLREVAGALLDQLDGYCTCGEDFVSRGVQDPTCEYCDIKDEIENLKQALEDK